MFTEQDFERILICGTEAGISDIYFEPGKPVFWRRYNELSPLLEYVPTKEDLYRIFSKLATDDKKELYHCKEPVMFSVNLDGFRYRANVAYTGGKISMHFHTNSRFIPALKDLGEIAQIADKINVKRGGLFLISGGLNSGKTTTAYSILNMINQREPYRIITLTETIEYEIPKGRSMVSQRTYEEDYEDTATAVRYLARENPDVVYIENLDTNETVKNTCALAESGCFVITEYTGIFNSARHVYSDFVSNMYSVKEDYSSNLISGILYQELKPCTRGGLIAAISYEGERRNDEISLDESIDRLKKAELIKEEI